MDSVTRVIGLPWVFSLRGDKSLYVWVAAQVNSAAAGLDQMSPPTKMDGGANICVTGLLELLVDVKSIPPRQVFTGLLLHKERSPPTDSG
jgi:hypothetical protein